jgi:hypothetical protein
LTDSEIGNRLLGGLGIFCYFDGVMEKALYLKVRSRVMGMANDFVLGDEAAKAELRKSADFFPISSSADGCQSIMIRVGGNLFLVENTQGGEKGVFALLVPLM